MAYVKSGELAEFKALARSMYFSNEAVDRFCGSATAGQMRAMAGMIRDERAVRARRKRERLMRKAKFPAVKSFDSFDFSHVALPEGYSASDMRSLAFVDSAQDFVFHGKTGRGKTHLAIALGALAVDAGREARFFTAAGLVLALKRAAARSDLDGFLKDVGRCELLILDELGYVPIDIEGARLLFQVLSDCYEKRSVIVTTNIEFGMWGAVFGDDKMAAAVIDRLVHHGRLVEFNGESRRMSEALMLGEKAEGK